MQEQQLGAVPTKRELKRQEKLKKKEEKRKKKRALRLIPANRKGKHVMHLLNLLRVFVYPIHYIMYPFKMYGHKKVGKGACIYVGNHYSLWDIAYPAHTTWEGIHYITKESVLHLPVVGYFARKVGAIAVMRDGSDIRALMDAMKALKSGEKVSLYPEGTRNRGDGEEFLPFYSGAALMAIKTQTPIVPIVICNKPRVWHKTHVRVGEPFELTEYYGKKLSQEEYAEADNSIRDRLYALREEHRAEQRAKKEKRKRK